MISTIFWKIAKPVILMLLKRAAKSTKTDIDDEIVKIIEEKL